MDIETEYKAAKDYNSLVDDGYFNAKCVGFSSSRWGRIPKLFLNFEIVSNDESYDGTKLFMAFNMPYDGYIPTGSKYYKTWSKVNGKIPSRNAKMSPRIFLNKTFRIKVRTVKPKDGDYEYPEVFHYSVVESIIEQLLN